MMPSHGLTCPVRPCSTCRRAPAVVRGRCRGCYRSVDRDRGTFRERGYTSTWDRRAADFKRRYPYCGMRPGNRKPVMSHCVEQGRQTPAYQVDHVVPHRGNQQLFWDEQGNWQSLCRSCGSAKSRAGL